MRILGKVGLLLAGLGLSFAANAEAKKYLVQFKQPAQFAAVSNQVSKARFGSSQLTLLNTNAAIKQSLNNVQLLIIESSDLSAIAALRNNPAIAFVEEEIFHPAPPKMARYGAAIGPKGRMALDQPWGIGAVKAPQAWANGKGAGTRVMVLDTGIDKDHPALLSRFEKGRNFTGGSADAYNDTQGHGTHVAGTILADGINSDGLSGVAPEAKVLMGKVCGDYGCGSTAISQGIDWAIAEKVDVINMSLGGPMLGSGEMAAVQRAEAAGVMIVAASGNNGQAKVSYPAALDTVLAVGATDVANLKADFSNWGPQLDVMGPGVDVLSSVPRGSARASEVSIDTGKGLTDVKSQAMYGSPMRPLTLNTLVYVGLGKPGDYAGIDVRGKYALISRGEIAFKDKVATAIQNGASGVIIFNNAPGLILGGLTEDGSEVAVPVTMIEQAAGTAAKDALAQGFSVTSEFGVTPADYDRFAGTSMASPHVAGVAALVRAANKTLTPAQVRDILKATSTPLGPNEANQYGSGLVNAEAAVQRALSFVPVELRAAN